MQRRDVVGGDVPGRGSAAQGHRGLKGGGVAGGAHGRLRVRDDPGCGLSQSETAQKVLFGGVNADGVAGPAKGEEFLAAADAVIGTGDLIQGDDRTELLRGQGVLAPDAGDPGGKGPGERIYLETGRLGEDRRGTADRPGVHQTALSDHERRNLRRFLGREDVNPFRLEGPHHLLADRRVVNQRLLGGAQRSVVERLPGDHVANRPRGVCGSMHVDRHVAGPHAVGGLPGGVGRANQADAAGGEDHRGVAALHQRLGGGERYRFQALQCAFGKTARSRRPLEHGEGLDHALPRGGMRGENHRTSGFHPDQSFEDRGRGGIRGRDDRGRDAHGLADFGDARGGIVADDSHRFDGCDVRGHPFGREEVLGGLVLDVAVSGFAVREFPEPGGLGNHGPGHRRHDPVHVRLGQRSHRGERSVGACDLVGRLGERGPVVCLVRFGSHETQLTAFGGEDQLPSFRLRSRPA